MTTRSSASRSPLALRTRRSAGYWPARVLISPACTRTSAPRSTTPPVSRSPRTGSSSLPCGSATSTGYRSPNSTSAAGSASRIRLATTRRTSGSSPAACAARPRLSVEPGRAIAGPGTVTIYQVGTVKDVDGLRTYVSVDGGMSDNIRTALYDADYTCVLASRESAAPPMLSRVVGRHCESGDIVVRDAYLPADTAAGDLLAVAATGAYCRSMASNYNHVPRPPVVAVAGGTARLMLRRETTDDLLRLDVG